MRFKLALGTLAMRSEPALCRYFGWWRKAETGIVVAALSVCLVAEVVAAEGAAAEHPSELPQYVRSFIAEAKPVTEDIINTCVYVLCAHQDPRQITPDSLWDVPEPFLTPTGLAVNYTEVEKPFVLTAVASYADPIQEIASLDPEIQRPVLTAIREHKKDRVMGLDLWMAYFDLQDARERLAERAETEGWLSDDVLAKDEIRVRPYAEVATALALDRREYRQKLLRVVGFGGRIAEEALRDVYLYPREWAAEALARSAIANHSFSGAVTDLIRMRPEGLKVLLEEMLAAAEDPLDRLACAAALESLGIEGHGEEVERLLDSVPLDKGVIALINGANDRACDHLEEYLETKQPYIFHGVICLTDRVIDEVCWRGNRELAARFEPLINAKTLLERLAAWTVVAYFPDPRHIDQLTQLLKGALKDPGVTGEREAVYYAAALLRCVAARQGKAVEFVCPPNRSNWRLDL